jgi:hypothetical protein
MVDLSGLMADGPPLGRHVGDVPFPDVTTSRACWPSCQSRNRERGLQASRGRSFDPDASRPWNHGRGENAGNRTVGYLGERMHWPDGTRIPPGKLLLMLALAAGSWGLIYLAAVGLWPHRAVDPVVAVAAHAEPEAPPRASLPDGSQVKLRRETGKRGERIGAPPWRCAFFAMRHR